MFIRNRQNETNQNLIHYTQIHIHNFRDKTWPTTITFFYCGDGFNEHKKHVSRDERVISRLESVIQFQWKVEFYVVLCITTNGVSEWVSVCVLYKCMYRLYLCYAQHEQNSTLLVSHIHACKYKHIRMRPFTNTCRRQYIFVEC